MTEPQDPGEALSLTADTLGRDILEELLAEIKEHIGFSMLPTTQQEDIIERLRKRTRYVITEGLSILFRGAFPACEATLDGIRIKGGLHLTLKIAKGARNWHEVVEAEGKQVLLVMAEPDQYLERMDEIKARANQGDLFNGEYQGNKGYRRDYTPPPPETSWADVTEQLKPPAPDEPAPEIPADDTPPPAKTMSEQVIEALATVHVVVSIETADKWSEQECVCAYHWAVTMAKDPDAAPARPWWLPMPDTLGEDIADMTPATEQAQATEIPGTDESDDTETEEDDADATA